MGRFIGIIYDIVDDQIIDRSCIEREDEGLAHEDAVCMCHEAGCDAQDAYVYDQQLSAIIFDS